MSASVSEKAGDQLRIGYVVSRFPAASETFVVRELNGIAADPGLDVELMSLFPSSDGFAHPSAEPWLPRLRRPTPAQGALAAARWLVRRPLRTAGIAGRVIASTWRRPPIMVRSLAALLPAAALAEYASEREIDHLHAHFASYPTLAAWACRRLCGVTYSFTAHAYDIFVDQSMLAVKLAEADFACTISEYNRRFIEDYASPADPTPVHVVHMGVDPTAYEFRPRRAPAEGPVRILCVASLQEKKGQSVLFRAVVSQPELARVTLELAGGGDDRAMLEALAAELGIADRVRFHGAVAEQEVRRLLGEADVFVLPSIVAADGQMEGLPVALMESLACGLPTVASDMSGIPELIEDGVTGFLAAPGDAGALGAALARAVRGDELDLRAGRALVESEFDVRESAVHMIRLFRSIPRSH